MRHGQTETSHPPGREARFRDLYGAHFETVLAYARRRSDQGPDAADVVAETFLVAWRRMDQLPGGAADRLWLFGVARRVLANHRRSDRRRTDLGERLRDRLDRADHQTDPAGPVGDRLVVTEALRQLGDLDREVLTLHVWEGLEPREIGVVLGVSSDTARTRLSRARRRLRALLGDAEDELSTTAPADAPVPVATLQET